MFLKLLQKLIDEYAGQASYMGGDLEEDLAGLFHDGEGVLRWGMFQALYDLGVLVALEPPADGEVTVDVKLAKEILNAAKLRRIERCLACKECGKDNGPAVEYRLKSLGRITLDDGTRIPCWERAAFCPDCAAAAGPEWVKP